ncbi:MAG: 3-phosphoshikimate 1-carboxyvinyltransferase [Defluviitaleaceae bacterium]|nr:3-phosphoshikimate 1-carboxyvinyltransferase [Defluviitaleaceae bacterium]
MTTTIKPKTAVGGVITVPGDKSISHRAVILGSISEGITQIHGFLRGEDNLATISCLRQLGVDFEEDVDNNILRVQGVGLRGLKPPKDVLFCGNSGTTMRLLCGLLAGQNFDSVLDGDPSLRKRPMERVATPLRLMGAEIATTGGNAPLKISGRPLVGIDYQMTIHSAQIKSAILLAGLYTKNKTKVTELKQGLTRNHTELMLANWQRLNGKIHICGDFSSAAFFVVLGLLLADAGLTIQNVGLNPTRTGLLTALKRMGGYIKTNITKTEGGEIVGNIFVKKSKLYPIALSGNQIPLMIDEIPIFTIAALFADGTTIISDAEELTVKETNRLQTITTELVKIGAKITADNQGMVIEGGHPISGATLDSHGDHRIAMSLAIAATNAQSPSIIQNANCADISFPDFYKTLAEL